MTATTDFRSTGVPTEGGQALRDLARTELLTAARIAQVPAPAADRLTIYDSRQPGLSLVVSASGARTFYFAKRSPAGRLMRLSLGPATSATLEAARAAAADLYARVLRGEDVADARRAARNAQRARKAAKATPRAVLTVGAAWEDYLCLHAIPHMRPSSLRSARCWWRLYLEDWRHRPLTAVTVAAASALHVRLGQEAGEATANRVRILARALWSFARTHLDYDGRNPWSAVTPFPQDARSRVLDAEELPRFLTALSACETDFRELVLVLLHMGCRRGNAQRMRWSDVDLSSAIWSIPGSEAKAKRPIVLPIPGPVLAMLKARRERTLGEWVFPSPVKPGQPVSDLWSAWHTLCKRAKIEDLTFHDLRRSLASLMATQGTPLLTIATLLGHADPSTTARTYARLGIAALRAPLNAASALLIPDPVLAPARGRALTA